MFNDVSYWKEEVPGTGICKPANTFSSMFNANSSDGQLEVEIAALANAFSETVLSESDVFSFLRVRSGRPVLRCRQAGFPRMGCRCSLSNSHSRPMLSSLPPKRLRSFFQYRWT